MMAVFLSPCVRKELPVAGPVDIQKYARKAVTGRFYV